MLKTSTVALLLVGLLTSFVIAAVRPFSTLAATTYYVATTGNDSNPGTQAAPFKTVRKAGLVADPGDTVYVRGGTYYTDPIPLAKIGSATSRIVFKAYPGEKAILDGSQSNDANPDIFTVAGQYYDIVGFEIRWAKRIGVNLWGSKHIRVLNNTIHDSHWGAVYSGNGAVNLHFEGNVVYNNAHNNDKFQFGHQGGWPSAVNLTGDGDVVVKNQIYENWGEGIGAYGTNHYVANNVLHDNYAADIYVNNIAQSTIENNFIYSLNKPEFHRFQASAIGIAFANESGSEPVQFNNNKIINNIVTGPRHWGLYHWNGAGGGLKNSLIAHNTVVVAGEGGVFHVDNSSHSNTTIANNIFYQLNSSQPLTDFATVAGLTFKHNLWFGGNGGSGSGGKGSGPGDVTANPQVVNANGQSAADFRVQAGSPAINAGTALTNVPKDHFGGARPQGSAPDIGAHEFGSTPTSSPAPSPVPSPCPSPSPSPSVPPSVGTVRIYLPLVASGSRSDCR